MILCYNFYGNFKNLPNFKFYDNSILGQFNIVNKKFLF